MSIDAEKWVADAIADGWTVKPGGPWSESDEERSPGDKSIVIKKNDLIVWFVNRTDEFDYHEEWTAAWCEDGDHKINIPQHYDAAMLSSAQDHCSYCGRNVGRENMKRIGYAGFICEVCDTPEKRAEVEPRGWTH